MTPLNIIALVCCIIAFAGTMRSYAQLKHLEHITLSDKMPLTIIRLYMNPLKGRIEGGYPVLIRKLNSLGTTTTLNAGKPVTIIGTAGKDDIPDFFIISRFGQKWIAEYHDVSISEPYVKGK